MNNRKKRQDLSAQLDRITAELDDSDRVEEKTQRTSLLSVLKNYTISRFRFGQALASYKEVCRLEGIWLAASKAIAKEIGRSQRTVFRILSDYQRVADTPEPVLVAMKREGYDPAAPKNETLLHEVLGATPGDSTPQQVQKVVQRKAAYLKQTNAKKRSSDSGTRISEDDRIISGLRQDIRKRLANVPDPDQKWYLLREAICQESFEVWGDKEKWTAEFIPPCEAGTPDGRQDQPQAVAA